MWLPQQQQQRDNALHIRAWSHTLLGESVK